MLQQRGTDSVAAMPRNSRKPIEKKDALEAFTDEDLLIQWTKPQWNKKSAYTHQEWEKLPETLMLRQIEIERAGSDGEAEHFFLITTLLDPQVHPAEQLKKLYFRRWEIELFFRNIKTCMGMDILRCKTPEMIRKEILMHFIVYNCIRHLIYEAAQAHGAELRRISFKGALQSIRRWEPCLHRAHSNRRERLRQLDQLQKSIIRNPLPDRPGRSELRCVKRRPKSYPYLNAPRHELKMKKPHATIS